MRFNDAFDRYGITKTLAAGALFLPYLFFCGPIAYGVLLVLWSLALGTGGEPA